MIAGDTLVGAVLLGIAGLCFAVVILRNLVSAVQLAVSAVELRTRARPARSALELWTRYSDLAPPVSVIAPCFNEEMSVIDSVRALLGLEYPDHEVVVVNDGSTDGTLARLVAEFGLEPVNREPLACLHTTQLRGVYGSPRHPNLIVVDKDNGRKADAVNAGIAYATAPLVCVIDADSIIEPDGLLRGTEPFIGDTGKIVAVGGMIRIANGSIIEGGHVRRVRLPAGWLPRFQVIEYLRAFLTARVASARLDMLLLVSGAFGIFRRSVLVEIGGFRHDTVGEDLEIVTRIHRHMREQGRDYRIAFVPDVVCWTDAPFDRTGLGNQRTRWEQGALETLVRHRRMIFNPRYGRIGMVALPLVALEDVVGPPCELTGYAIMPALFLLGLTGPAPVLAYMAVTLLFGAAISLGALALEELQMRRTPSARDLATIAVAALLENIGYRQVMLFHRLRGMWRFARGDTRWASAARAGFATA